MFLLIVIVILITASSILANIYGGLFSFQQNYKDSENYINSQYAAISALERGLLVTKYKEPSFVGSGGFIGTGSWGEISELFSDSFEKLTAGNNGLIWEINSKCNNITGILTNNKILIIKGLSYTDTGDYVYDTSAGTTCIVHGNGYITGHFYNTHIHTNTGNIKRKINQWQRLGTGFIVSTGYTMIDYSSINSNSNLTFNSGTIDPSQTGIIGNKLCTSTDCYTGKDFDYLLDHNEDILFYIQDDFQSSNHQRLGNLNYNFHTSYDHANCQNYYIKGIAIIGKYKQELSIQKPTFNYRNPNRKQFIFPYYY